MTESVLKRFLNLICLISMGRKYNRDKIFSPVLFLGLGYQVQQFSIWESRLSKKITPLSVFIAWKFNISEHCDVQKVSCEKIEAQTPCGMTLC
jgi:hypothetical protein